MDYFGGVEAGGTKFKCMIGTDPDYILAEGTFPTSSPGETLPIIINFFKQAEVKHQIKLKGLGFGFFGPINLVPGSDSYGRITTTPKLAWQNFDVLKVFQDAFSIPIKLDTDVNAAALAEGKWGAAIGLPNYVYITVGTGIGGGIIVDGKPVQGLIHTEAGHILISRSPDDHYPGVCPFHENCVEGLASGPSIAGRWTVDPSTLPANHAAWKLESYYIAQLVHNITLTCTPHRVILGGGVMQQQGLIEKVRKQYLVSLNNYVASVAMTDTTTYIVPPALGNRAGVLGAIALIKFDS